MFNSRMAKRMANKKRKGFTLVELVVVILIIAILAVAIFRGGATVIRQARERQVQNDLKNFGTYVQDMLYDNPELQYHQSYSYGEYYTYDPTTKEFTSVQNISGNAANDPDDATKLDTAGMTVMDVLDDYLTDDFKLGDIRDAWDNPYCFSYNQVAAAKTGETSSCIVVINSLGNNSLDETSNGQAVPAQQIATLFATGMAEDVDSDGDEKWDSAAAFLADTTVKDAIKAGDDYGVVIVMIDGQVSVDYYGF